jgi:hypothetical protein
MSQLPKMPASDRVAIIFGMTIPQSQAQEFLDFYRTILGMVRTSLCFIHIHSLHTLTSTLAHSHLPLYRQSTISILDLDLERIAAMGGIAQRHLSMRESFVWFSKAHGDIWDGVCKESSRERRYFAHQYQVVWEIGMRIGVRRAFFQRGRRIMRG